jgi:hypothetical protein
VTASPTTTATVDSHGRYWSASPTDHPDPLSAVLPLAVLVAVLAGRYATRIRHRPD